MILGDLNEIHYQGEKSRDCLSNFNQCKELNNFMDAPCMVDLGYIMTTHILGLMQGKVRL